MNKNRKIMAICLIVVLCCTIMPRQMHRVYGYGEDMQVWEKVDVIPNIVYGNGSYVKFQDKQLSYSKNGTDWIASKDLSSYLYLNSGNLLFCGEYFWFSTNTYGLWLSKDGVEWEIARTSGGESKYVVIYQGGRYVLLEFNYINDSGNTVFNYSSTLYSTNGKNWREIYDPQEKSIFSIVNANGMIVGVGASGRIAILGDNNQWKEVRQITKSSLTDIAYGNGCFIAVGSNGTILKSTDGVTWEIQNEGKYIQFNSVDFSGDAFLVKASTDYLYCNEDSNVGAENWIKYIGNYFYHDGYLYEYRSDHCYYATKLSENANTDITNMSLSEGYVSKEGKNVYKLIISEQTDFAEIEISLGCNRACGWIETGEGKTYPIEKVNKIPVSGESDEIIINVVAEDGVTEEQYRAVIERKKLYQVETAQQNGGYTAAPSYVMEGYDLTLIAEEYPGYEFVGWKMNESDELFGQEKQLQLENVHSDVRYDAVFRVKEGNGIIISANTTCAKINDGKKTDGDVCEEEEVRSIQLTALLSEEQDSDLRWEVLNTTDSYVNNGVLFVGKMESRQEIVVKVSQRDNPEICGYLPITIMHIGEKGGQTEKQEGSSEDSTDENRDEKDTGGEGGNIEESVSENTSKEETDKENEKSEESVSENTSKEETDKENEKNEESVSENTSKEEADKENEKGEESIRENTNKEEAGKINENAGGDISEKNDKDDNGRETDKSSNNTEKGDAYQNNPYDSVEKNNEDTTKENTHTLIETGLKKGRIFYTGNLRYKITGYSKNGKKTVSVLGYKKPKESIVIPAKIKYRGTSFQVTAIAPKAFLNNRKVKKIVLGSNIKTIGKKAFSGIHAKAVIKCPKSKKIKYRIMIRKSGIGKMVQIK